MIRRLTFATLSLILASCGTPQPRIQTESTPQPPKKLTIGPGLWMMTAKHIAKPPLPMAHPFSFKVNAIAANHILDIIAKELSLGYSVDECGSRPVSLQAEDLPLKDIVQSIEDQTDSVIQLSGQQLVLKCQAPVMRIYNLDYLSLKRRMSDSSTLSSALNSPTPESSLQQSGNRSELTLQSDQTNDVWRTVTRQIESLISPNPSPQKISTKTRTIHDEGVRGNHHKSAVRKLPYNSLSRSEKDRLDITVTQTEQHSGRVIASPESGTITVLATPRQQAKVAQWLNQFQHRLTRQIVIDAVIAEVTLKHRYEKGLDWNLVRKSGLAAGLRIQGNPLTDPGFIFQIDRQTPENGINAVLSLLQEFGKTSVISSPSVAAINEQPAVLKVIDNRVYFTTDVQTSAPTQSSPAFSTYTTRVQTVPVGFLMTVTAQIADDNQIMLRVRPTLSRIVGFVPDPNPALKALNIVSQVPEVQTREIESILRLHDGEMAVLGGLKQREIRTLNRSIPERPASLAALTDNEKDSEQQIELVILLRAHSAANQWEPSSHDQNDTQTRQSRIFDSELKSSLTLLEHQQVDAARALLLSLNQQDKNAPEPAFNLAILEAMQGNPSKSKSWIEEVNKRCQRQICDFSTHLISALLETTAHAQ